MESIVTDLDVKITVLTSLRDVNIVMYRIYESLEDIEGDLSITNFLTDKATKEEILLDLVTSAIDESLTKLNEIIENFKNEINKFSNLY